MKLNLETILKIAAISAATTLVIQNASKIRGAAGSKA